MMCSLIGPIVQFRSGDVLIWNIHRMIGKRNKTICRKAHISPTLSTPNPTLTALSLSLGLHNDKQACDGMSYGTIF